jgi:hypothetical protein
MSRLLVVAATVALALTACTDLRLPQEVVPERPTTPSPTPVPPASEPVLFSVGGPLELRGAAPEGRVRFGVAWFPALAVGAPERPRGASSGTVAVVPPLPARWGLDLTAAPPLEARGLVETAQGATGAISYGVLVAFRDGDGDETLVIDADGRSRDVVLGSSAGAMPFDFEAPAEQYLLVWREGLIGDDEPAYAPGFNLVRVTGARRVLSVMPPRLDVPLALTQDPRLALTFCDEAFAAPAPEFPCGQRLYASPTVVSELASSPAGASLRITVRAGQRLITDAVVTVDGWLLPEADGAYSLEEPFPSLLVPGLHTVRVEAPGLETVMLTQPQLVAPQLLAPSSDEPLALNSVAQVRWGATLGASRYGVALTAAGVELFSGTTSDLVSEVPLPAEPGEVELRLRSEREQATGRHRVRASAESAWPLRLAK